MDDLSVSVQIEEFLNQKININHKYSIFINDYQYDLIINYFEKETGLNVIRDIKSIILNYAKVSSKTIYEDNIKFIRDLYKSKDVINDFVMEASKHTTIAFYANLLHTYDYCIIDFNRININININSLIKDKNIHQYIFPLY